MADDYSATTCSLRRTQWRQDTRTGVVLLEYLIQARLEVKSVITRLASLVDTWARLHLFYLSCSVCLHMFLFTTPQPTHHSHSTPSLPWIRTLLALYILITKSRLFRLSASVLSAFCFRFALLFAFLFVCLLFWVSSWALPEVGALFSCIDCYEHIINIEVWSAKVNWLPWRTEVYVNFTLVLGTSAIRRKHARKPHDISLQTQTHTRCDQHALHQQLQLFMIVVAITATWRYGYKTTGWRREWLITGSQNSPV